jgi:hypothetical protein
VNTVPRRIIDTCCLLDLYAGWNELEPLAQMQSKWYVCTATMNEARYIRDFDSAGNMVQVPVDLGPSLEQKLILTVDATDEEFSSFLQYAGQLGDGEAMSLAIALHRNWVLATDDGKATKMAIDAGVETTSTPEIIKTWTELNDDNLGNLNSVLLRIEMRACFRPSRSSPLFGWWSEYSGN